MTITKNQPTTTLPKAFLGYKPSAPGNHVISLVPGVPGAEANVCWLCSNEVPEATAHLELCCYAEMRNGELEEGLRICPLCASMNEQSWKKTIREYLIENLAYVISRIPSSEMVKDPDGILPAGKRFYFDMCNCSSELICMHQIAQMGCDGIDIQPEALEFIKMKGGAE